MPVVVNRIEWIEKWFLTNDDVVLYHYTVTLKLGLQKTRAFNYDWKGMSVRKGVKTAIRPSFWKLGLRTQNFQQIWSYEVNSD